MYLAMDNHFTGRGRVVKEPYANYSEKGNMITTITVAQNTPFRDENGEYEKVFISYTAIDTKKNPIGTRLAKMVTKGTLISFEGFHSSHRKEGPDGKMEYYETKRISSFRNEETREKTEERMAAIQNQQIADQK